MEWSWTRALEYFWRIVEFLPVTFEATALIMLLGMTVGLVFAIGKRSRFSWVRVVVDGFAEFLRRTPVLIQLYFVFYVLPDIGITLSALTSGVIALGIYKGSYISEVYRAGIDAVPKGQWEAARILNIPTYKIWWHVILPQAVPPMIPPLGNFLLLAYKESALLSLIGVIEIMGMARIIGIETYRFLEPITVAGLIFLMICLPSSYALRRLEKRYMQPENSGRVI